MAQASCFNNGKKIGLLKGAGTRFSTWFTVMHWLLQLKEALKATNHGSVVESVALLGNDNVMTLSRRNKMGLSSNSRKRCDVGRQFWFCHIWITWRGGVVHPRHVTADIYIFLYKFALFAMQSIANITFYKFRQMNSSVWIFGTRIWKFKKI